MQRCCRGVADDILGAFNGSLYKKLKKYRFTIKPMIIKRYFFVFYAKVGIKFQNGIEDFVILWYNTAINMQNSACVQE